MQAVRAYSVPDLVVWPDTGQWSYERVSTHIGPHLLSTVLSRESGMSHMGQKARRGALLRAVTHDNQMPREPVPESPPVATSVSA